MTTFKLFAGTDVGLRDNNEDNFTVCPDLTKGEWVIPSDQQTEIPLGLSGCLLVVADGMGGQNAGEVASAIAISTVQEMFASTYLKANVISKPDGVRDFMKKVIVEADRRVKKHSSTHSEAEGMGSTIVIAWLLGNNVHVAWMGDSRAYSYSPKSGLKRLSKDHSYVQKLVDSGKLTEQQALEHPDSNVITRSLGDATQKAKPDAITHAVRQGDIILLCSDGLCGFCNDEQICGIIAQNQLDLITCKDVLIEAALNANGSDNITVALLQIVQTDAQRMSEKDVRRKGELFVKSLLSFIVFLAFLMLIFVGYRLFIPSTPNTTVIEDDSIPSNGSDVDIIVSEKQEETNPNENSMKEQVDIINTIVPNTTDSGVINRSEDSGEPERIEGATDESKTPKLIEQSNNNKNSRQ